MAELSRNRALLVGLLLGALSSAACRSSGVFRLGEPDRSRVAGLSVDESSMSATVQGGEASVTLPVRRSQTDDSWAGEATVTLLSLVGEKLAERVVSFSLPAGSATQTVDVEGLTGIAAESGPGDLAEYVVRYQVAAGSSVVSGKRSLFEITRRLATVVLGPDELFAGQENHLRVTARQPANGEPVPGATVSVGLATVDDEGQEAQSPLWSGSTDEFGVAQVTIAPPEGVGSAELVVTVQHQSETSEVRHAVLVQRSHRILLTTDKPLYQPGQTIHLRALSLRLPDRQPSAGLPAVFEVLDPRGNIVFRQDSETNDYGVAAAQFNLARRVNMGRYTVRVTVDDAVQERTVTVDRYALPKFRIAFESDRSFYLPGESLRGLVDADYLFGEPVAGGTVTVRASQFDVDWVVFAERIGTTDEEGQFAFDLDLPSYFVGLPLEQGGSFVKLDVSVTDTAGQVTQLERSVTVAQGAVTITLVPERPQLVPDVPNQVFLLTADPTGAPLATRCTISVGGGTTVIETDERGFATFEITPQAGTPSTVSIQADDGRGGTAQHSQTFNTDGTAEETVLLRTDRSLYEVGDQVELSIYSPRLQDRVYLDVVRQGQTVWTEIVEVDEGWTTRELDLSSELAGSLVLSVYYLAESGDIIRDQRVIFVSSADDLALRLQLERPEYAPAETARLQLSVTDAAGTGVQAAVGLQVVDEAVFALSEQQPGLERIYFLLEEELSRPSFEVHGFDQSSIFGDGPPESSDQVAQDAARVLFAANSLPAFGIDASTERRLTEVVRSHSEQALRDDLNRLLVVLRDYVGDRVFGDQDDAAASWVRRSSPEWYDPWGQHYHATYQSSQLTLSSAGCDEQWETDDDVTQSAFLSLGWEGADGDAERDWDNAAGGVPDVVFEDPAAPPSPEPTGGGGAEPPRIRQWFPETLFVDPAVLTDAQGRAVVDIPLADSITTWRASAIASSRGGTLGSGTLGIRVFQDFFVDLNLPATLTLGDEITVPVVVYNYLDQPQTVSVEVTSEDWFTLLSPGRQTLTLSARQVSSVPLTLRVERVGWHELQAVGRAGTVADGLRRRIEVLPSGQSVDASQSDVLTGSAGGTRVSFSFSVPPTAVPEASELLVKLYPGVVAQAIEGLDSILRLPSGCFEQTSSSTYPNIMVLRYLQETSTSTPEVEMRAREYINQGYQRLLTFEVDGGGFEWFGNSPAHKILTAYGLMEFADMAQVHPVDPAVLTRTAQWLAAQQESDGSWTPDAGGIAEGAINNYQNSTYRTTAYLLWALLEAGFNGPQVSRAVAYLQAHRTEAADSYSRAIAAHALVRANPNDPVAAELLQRLAADATIQDGAASWGQESGSVGLTYSMGNAHELETTALVVDVLLLAGRSSDLANRGLTYLARSKDSFGNWETTQATVYALRAMIRSMHQTTGSADGTVDIFHNGALVQSVRVTPADADLFRQIDLKERVVEGGANTVELVMTGSGSLMYQVVGTYWQPWNEVPPEPQQELSIDVRYDRTRLSVNDSVTTEVTISNNTSGSLNMVMVDLGLPPGFDLMTDDLDQLVSQGLFLRYEVTGRQLLLYFGEIQAGPPVTLSYRLVARNPMRGEAPASTAYLYYQPDVRATGRPTLLQVE